MHQCGLFDGRLLDLNGTIDQTGNMFPPIWLGNPEIHGLFMMAQLS